MQAIPRTIPVTAHAGIASMYRKKHYLANGHAKNVLVIETNFHDKGDDADTSFADLLLNLEDIKNKAEEYAGPVDRIDIRAF